MKKIIKNINLLNISLFILIVFFVIPIKANAALPTLTTSPATSITTTNAMMWANVTSDGGNTITARGTCWGTSPSPTTNCKSLATLPAPKAYYKMNDNAGTSTIVDSMGSYNATRNFMFTSSRTMVGKVNSAQQMTSGEFINLPAGAPIASGSFSVSMWVKPSSIGTLQGLFGQGGLADQSYFQLSLESDGRFGVKVSNVFGVFKTPSRITAVANTWYHLVMVYDFSSNNLKLYVNGKYGAGYGPQLAIYNTGLARLGAIWSGASNYTFNGLMDDVRIYTSALTEDQVIAVYGDGAERGLVGLFGDYRKGFAANTQYYYRGYATNSSGTSYSTDGTFTTDNFMAPTNFSVACTASTIPSEVNTNFSWTSPSNQNLPDYIGWKIEKSINNGSTWTNVMAAPDTYTYVNNSGHYSVKKNNNYLFKVSAYYPYPDYAPISVYGPASSTVSLTGPGAPTGLTAFKYSGSSINLSWSAPASNGGCPMSGYKIERQPSGGAWSVLTANTGTTSTTYSDSTGVSGTTYQYRVSGVNILNTGSASNVSNAIVAGLVVPDAPTGVNAVHSPGAINISWTAPFDNGGSAITGYKIERYNGTSWATLVENTGSASTTYTDSTILNNISYSYRISAINSLGIGSASDVSNSVIFLPPGVPTGVNAVYSPGVINISWTAPANNGGSAITGYKIERYNGTSWATLVENTGSATPTTRSDTNLMAGTSYSYRVRAINSIGVSSASTVSSTVSFTATAPSAPTGLNVVCSGGKVNLSWPGTTNNGGSVITGYKIERQIAGGAWETLVANTNSTSTFYQDTGAGYVPVLGADSGSIANWVCKGTNGGTNSGNCSATRAPFNMGADNLHMTTNYCWAPKAGLLNFTWTYSNSDNNPETRFQFQVADKSDFTAPLIDRDIQVGASSNSMSVLVSVNPMGNGMDRLPFNDLSNSKTYYWRVKVYDSYGSGSAWRTGTSFVTEPHPWPTPVFSFTPTTPKASQDTHFVDQSSDITPIASKCYSDNWGTEYNCKDGSQITYQWNYGDNSSSTSIGDVYHKYTSLGTFRPSLRICDNIGCCTKEGSITVSGQKVPQWREVSPF